jgi:transposase
MPRISPLTTEQRERLRAIAETRAGTPSNRQLANEMDVTERLIEYYVRKYQHEMEQRDKRDVAVSRGSMQCEHGA